jgi:hypothetical protein
MQQTKFYVSVTANLSCLLALFEITDESPNTKIFDQPMIVSRVTSPAVSAIQHHEQSMSRLKQQVGT